MAGSAGIAIGSPVPLVTSGVATFLGGVVNTGMISAANTGVRIISAGAFSGGIIDNGTILAVTVGILVNSSGVISGGIQVSSKGTVSAGNAVIVENAATFAGGINNRGRIAAGLVRLSWYRP